MRKMNYISPEITLHTYAVEGGFGLSEQTPGLNIGIGSWEEENNDCNIK